MPQDEQPISHLQRRKIEGRVLIPFIDACVERFGEEAAHALVSATIRKIAAQEGQRWADALGSDMGALRKLAENVWAAGGGMDVELLGQSETHLDFDVTRCGYAEFYKELGLAKLGTLIHCSRDHAMVDGFNAEIALERGATIMEGGKCCNFRYRMRKPEDGSKS